MLCHLEIFFSHHHIHSFGMVGRKGGRVSNSSMMLFSMKIEEELPLLIEQNIHEWRFKGWVPGLVLISTT